jgi:hypothetical protein
VQRINEEIGRNENLSKYPRTGVAIDEDDVGFEEVGDDQEGVR